MGLDIWTSDRELDFHIGYFGFTRMRAFFVLHYGESLYNDYEEIIKSTMALKEPAIDEDKFCEKVGDLNIILEHSDCDGELSSQECKLLKPCLFVEEEAILKIYPNHEYANRIIQLMYEFIDLIKYCASNSDVKLIFG